MDALGTILVAVLIVWLAIGLMTGWLALEKGRSIGIWLVLGLLFGPLATLTVGLAPRGFSGFKACLECLEPIRTDATTCPYCSTDLLAAEKEEEQRIAGLGRGRRPSC